MDNLDDVISVKFIQEIMDWCGSHAVLSRVSDTSRVYLCGHSRVMLLLLYHGIPPKSLLYLVFDFTQHQIDTPDVGLDIDSIAHLKHSFAAIRQSPARFHDKR